MHREDTKTENNDDTVILNIMAKIFKIAKMSLDRFFDEKREGCLLSFHESLTISGRGHQVCSGAYNTKHLQIHYFTPFIYL